MRHAATNRRTSWGQEEVVGTTAWLKGPWAGILQGTLGFNQMSGLNPNIHSCLVFMWLSAMQMWVIVAPCLQLLANRRAVAANAGANEPGM